MHVCQSGGEQRSLCQCGSFQHTICILACSTDRACRLTGSCPVSLHYHQPLTVQRSVQTAGGAARVHISASWITAISDQGKDHTDDFEGHWGKYSTTLNSRWRKTEQHFLMSVWAVVPGDIQLDAVMNTSTDTYQHTHHPNTQQSYQMSRVFWFWVFFSLFKLEVRLRSWPVTQGSASQPRTGVVWYRRASQMSLAKLSIASAAKPCSDLVGEMV